VKLSYSQVQKYKQCPALYDFHYNQKLRSKYIGSPLFFGSAIDDAVGLLKIPLIKNPTDKQKEMLQETPEELFKRRMIFMNHNGEEINIKEYPFVNYSKSDIDTSLFTEGDLEYLNSTYFEEPLDAKDLQKYAEFIADQKRKEKVVEKNDFLAYNDICWKSLYRKGLMIIEAYKNEVIPEILEIVSIQEKVCITNDDGDEIMGFIDDIRIYKDEPDKVYINDDKTSSKAYKQEQLDESPQLTTYAFYKDTPYISYTVMEKSIRKKEPRVRITIMRGTTSDEYKEEVLEEYEDTMLLINEGQFPKDFNSGCKFYGAKCLYYEICHNNQMPDYIVDMKK